MWVNPDILRLSCIFLHLCLCCAAMCVRCLCANNNSPWRPAPVRHHPAAQVGGAEPGEQSVQRQPACRHVQQDDCAAGKRTRVGVRGLEPCFVFIECMVCLLSTPIMSHSCFLTHFEMLLHSPNPRAGCPWLHRTHPQTGHQRARQPLLRPHRPPRQLQPPKLGPLRQRVHRPSA